MDAGSGEEEPGATCSGKLEERLLFLNRHDIERGRAWLNNEIRVDQQQGEVSTEDRLSSTMPCDIQSPDN